ncbi:MAG TPA: endo alpha-1,4 polygalactosaminidase, partial [Anaerolineae bacterium]|nr:endo alpha-1,4 polygalactosaminidase [Anaerolineae bacterium]
MYVVHQYAPVSFTHQEPGALGRLKLSYPGTFDADWDGEDDTVNRAWLAELLSTVTDYASTHQVLVAVNEFGVMRWEPGAAQFMDDQMGLFEELGCNYALWAWDPSWSPWVEEANAFNTRCGPSPRGCDEDAPGELLEVIQRYWARNQVRPSNYSGASIVGEFVGEERSRLSEVAHWLYLIDVDLEPDTVEQIASSAYGMVVLDYIPSERENTDYPMAEVVARLHGAPHPKLVLAYVDIGEAEDYRIYWQPGWRVGDPAWIAGDAPDGWEGNYPVAYWDEAWRDIWLAEDGMLDQIVKAGFDGVYLDWVEAYSDEHVVALAEREDVDPVEEMVRWVGDIAAFGCAGRAGFPVIAQIAAELAERDDYLALIDAIAQEQVWFDGGVDNEPPGDCPQP